MGIDRQRCCAMIQFDSMEEAREALTAVKGTFIKNSRRLMVHNVCGMGYKKIVHLESILEP